MHAALIISNLLRPHLKKVSAGPPLVDFMLTNRAQTREQIAAAQAQLAEAAARRSARRAALPKKPGPKRRR